MNCIGLVGAFSVLLTLPLSARAADMGEPAEAFDLSRVRLMDGPFKQIQELHRTGMVGHLEPDRLLFPFRKNAKLSQPIGVTSGYGGWDDAFIQGHYAGHYLTAAARMFAATGDTSFRDKANYMVSVLAECQKKLGGGYLSGFPASRFDKLEANPRGGSVEYYTIHKVLAGLVDVARYCDNKEAFEVASKMSDYFGGRIAKLKPAQIEALFRTDYTGNPTNEYGGMAEALTDLYTIAHKMGDPNADRHLKLAAVFNRDWFIEPLLNGEDKLAGLHGNAHTAVASGLARYSLASGDERAAKAAENYWKLVVEKHSFVNGGNSFNEKLRAGGTEVAGKGDAALSPQTSEYCNTNNMLKLTRSLFERAPAVAYGDYYETALFNHILAAIAPDDGKVMYHMSMRPGDYRVHIDAPFCCQGTGIENTARFNEAIYFHRADELWVNLFIASTLDWSEKGIKLRLETSYPENGIIRLAVEAAAPVQATINFRIPGWVQGEVEARINDKPESVKPVPGTFLPLARTWQNGDVVELHLPLALRVRPSMDDPKMVSFFYGPVLLAGELGRDKMPASEVGGPNPSIPAFPVPALVTPNSANPELMLKPVDGKPITFTASMVGLQDRKPVDIELAPFYQVQHQRYAVYWKVLKPEELENGGAQTKSLSNAAFFIGDDEAEKSRNLEGERTETGSFSGRKWRDSSDGGWFSYRLPLATGEDQVLVCTYWGGETGDRNFDILVDGTKVGTQILNQNKPNEFFDVAYPIPTELVHGKQFVTVRFQASPGSKAGGVFDCRFDSAASCPMTPAASANVSGDNK